MLPVTLSVGRESSGKKKQNDDSRLAVFTRDKNQCRFCGFKSDKFQRVLPEQEPDPSKAATVDILCHGCHNLDTLYGKGFVIYLPGVSQADLNHLLRTAFVAVNRDDEEEKKEAIALLKKIYELARPVKKVWGTADAGQFGEVLLSLDEDTYKKRAKTQRGLLVAFRPSILHKETLDYWSNTLYAKFDLKTWQLFFDSYFGVQT